MDYPKDFIERSKNLLGNEFESFINSLENEAISSIRKNPNKNNNLSNLEKIDWCQTGFYLPSRPIFTLDPDFHGGAYYVQEASSMFLEQAVAGHFDESKKVIALDLCAAPGGKSTHLLSVLPKNSLLISNEAIKSRAKILKENIIKWGSANAVVTNNDPKSFSNLKSFFDIIVIDAPCSGEGMFRKDRKAISDWSLNNVKLCADRQKRIIADVWYSLKSGGMLVYCTCTYNKEENEDNVKWILENFEAKSIEVNLKTEWNVSNSLIEGVFTYRFYPHKIKGEGFCISILQKTDNENANNLKYKTCKNRNVKNIPSKLDFVKNYVLDNDNFDFCLENNKIKIFTKNFADEIFFGGKVLNCIKSGVFVGDIKGNDFVPSHEFALSTTINKNAFQKINLDKNEALKFLKKDILNNVGNTLGYNLICHNENALGWIKNLGNRVNNLYPQEWKIRMQIPTI